MVPFGLVNSITHLQGSVCLQFLLVKVKLKEFLISLKKARIFFFLEFTEDEKKHVGQEMSDILIYLVRLADKCDIDLPAAVLQKFEQNRQKYPVHKVYGKSDKYTAYK